MTKIRISDHFTEGKILRFTFPSMMMMMFYTTYILVDGLFISNYVGATAYAAVNMVGNYLLIFPAIGTMLGSGGAALISKTLGEKDRELASKQFSMVLWFSIILGTILTAAAFFTVDDVSRLQKAEGELLEDCMTYGHVAAFTIVFYIVQSEFQYFFTMVEKENLGFLSAVISGVINISLDALFVVGFKWGLFGAAFASFLGILFGAIFPIAYFLLHRNLAVQMGRPGFHLKTMMKVCSNGSSEMVVNLSVALVGMLFNYQLMSHSGEKAVAAYGVIQAVTIVFSAAFQGYTLGLIPVIGYHFGARNQNEIKSLFRKSLKILAVMSAVIFVITEVFADVFAGIFVSYDQILYEMAINGLRIYSSIFLFEAFNIFGSGFFTALNDGMNSAVISLARTFVFLVPCVLILPVFSGLNGIWISTTVAEVLALIITVMIGLRNRKKYTYM